MEDADATLFGGAGWAEALQKYAGVTHLTVQIYDAYARPIGDPVCRTPLFELLTPGSHDLGIFDDCVRRCLAQRDTPPAVVIVDRQGLTGVGVALTLAGEVVGVAVAGYAAIAFLDRHMLEHLARDSGCAFDRVWAVARRERHVPRERLVSYGELLRALCDTLLAENLRTREQKQTSARLLETLQTAEAARTRAEAAERSAETANRAKDEFLATVSHELRSPLGAILTWTHLLQTGALDPTKSARALETIHRCAKAQKQLIEDLLDVSRVIAGKLRLEVEPVDLGELIERILELARPAAVDKGVALESELRARAVILGDPGRLQQVVGNLLSNAIKFTPREGRIGLRCEVTASHAVIRLSDTGTGISAHFLPHVFEAFSQADSSSTRAHVGLGLGLAVVRQLVDLHGGTVRAESRGEGYGATFTVTLPLPDHDLEVHRGLVGPTAADQQAFDQRTLLEGVRVLVVDDEADAREWITAVLLQRRARVTTAASVGEALEAHGRVHPDILISDIAMPGEDGYTLIRKVRALGVERGGEVPALALTAYASPEDRAQALAAGYHVHMAKPLEPTALVAAVANLASAVRLPL